MGGLVPVWIANKLGVHSAGNLAVIEKIVKKHKEEIAKCNYEWFIF